MKGIFNLTLLWLLATLFPGKTYADTGNIAYADGNVRFTLISDGMIRLEYSPDGHFTDAKTLVAVEREYAPVQYKLKGGKWIEISTDRMKIRYLKGSGPFSKDNLKISSVGLTPSFEWRPGDRQKHNLKGTFRTLDKMDGETCTSGGLPDCPEGEAIPLEDGLLARDGWTLIDDSETLLFDGDPEWEWAKQEKRPEGTQDWYFMAYGHDYASALKDFTLVAGKMPLPPRYAFGYWWSRYWMYSDKSLRDLTRRFQSIGMPLDVLVIDMDWHYTDEGRGGWTGWTWNKELFPDHRRLLSDLNSMGYNITLNLHPADGVKAYEEKYPLIASDLGIDAASRTDIPWIGSDKKFMTSLFDRILTPMEDDGVSFWWLDWQQHLYDPVVQDLKNTWWCNYMFFTHAEKFGKRRPLIYHRWSGLGNHRYQIGFSGDAIISWKSLDFQPYFNSTASNVLYGYWSHDIGGHMNGEIIPEMYVRWLQFGAFSPIMRTHSAKGNLKKEPWVFDNDVMDIILSTVRSRYDMAPYVYTMARKAYDDGVALCRPMYYSHPADEQAYEYRNQYMFGDNILVSPITTPMSGSSSLQKVWLPEGRWYEMATGEMIDGGMETERKFKLDEYPVYIAAGSVIPFNTDTIRNLSSNSEPYVINVFPGISGSFSIYEDNGDDKDYAHQFATTHVSAVTHPKGCTIEIAPRKGEYPGMPDNRKYIVKVNNAFSPKEVKVNGKPVSSQYNGTDFAVMIDFGDVDCTIKNTLELFFREDVDNSMLDGMKGKARRTATALETLKELQPFITFSPQLARLGSISQAMEYHEEKQPELISDFLKGYAMLDTLLTANGVEGETLARILDIAVWNGQGGTGKADL